MANTNWFTIFIVVNQFAALSFYHPQELETNMRLLLPLKQFIRCQRWMVVMGTLDGWWCFWIYPTLRNYLRCGTSVYTPKVGLMLPVTSAKPKKLGSKMADGANVICSVKSQGLMVLTPRNKPARVRGYHQSFNPKQKIVAVMNPKVSVVNGSNYGVSPA